MKPNDFYNSIDRVLPRSFFCLEEIILTTLNEEYYSTVNKIKIHCYYLPDKYVIVPIKDAIKKIFISCIDNKYKYLLIDRMSKYVFCITPNIKEFLAQYRQPKYIVEVASINHTEMELLFFKELLNLGFLQFSDSLSENENEIDSDITSMISFLTRRFFNVKLLRQRGANLCFLVEDADGQKMFLKQFRYSERENKKSFERKISIIKKFQDSDYFLKLLHYDIDYMFYVVNYFNGNDLEEVCYAMSLESKIDVINKIVNSVAFLHSRNIVHGDLHLGQFLLSDDGKLKIIDYDMVADITGGHFFPFMGATCEYIEPESLSRNPFVLLEKEDLNYRAEIYRLGVLIFNLIYESPPFHELTWEMLYESKQNCEIRFDNIDNRGVLIPNELITIMKKCLFKCPEKRFSSACEIIPLLNDIKISVSAHQSL